MNQLDRIVASIVRSDVPLHRRAVAEAVERVRPTEAPLAPDGVAAAAVDAVVGLGPLEALLAEPTTSDVLVNGDGTIWVEREGELHRTETRFPSPDAVVAAIRRTIAPLGLRLDRAVPAVAARLPDGSRLHALIPPASVDGPLVAIRRFIPTVESLDSLIEKGSVDDAGALVLRDAVRERRNVLVSGGTGSGKTTLLNVLAAEIARDERIVTIEDSAELDLPGHVVRLEAHPPNHEGAGEVTIRALLAHALRLRPDRILVGEVRGAEAADMVQALNTGHRGSMSTIHANDPASAIGRLEVLAAREEGPVGSATVRAQILTAIDAVVHTVRVHDPNETATRRVQSVSTVSDDGLLEVYRCS